LVKELGFKYLSEIGEHPLGSKAGEEAPATQPSAAAMQRARDLWAAGIKAEKTQDWPSAIHDYEELKKIDPSNRPQTDRVIDNAIQLAKGQMAK
jgi:hypothetical protein